MVCFQWLLHKEPLSGMLLQNLPPHSWQSCAYITLNNYSTQYFAYFFSKYVLRQLWVGFIFVFVPPSKQRLR
jgi:hypothetical protein